MSYILAVDIGNTTISVAQFPELVEVGAGDVLSPLEVWRRPYHDLHLEDLTSQLPEGPCIWQVSSVNHEMATRLLDWLGQARPSDKAHLLRHFDFPLELNVDQPEKVGIDRLAAAAAGNVIRTDAKPAIVIDAGSAVTVDVVSSGGVFQGGYIFPGLQLSLSALSQGTDQLPRLTLTKADVACVGKNTHDAMQIGVFWAVNGAIQGILDQLLRTLDQDCDIIATGGDMAKFLPYLTFTIRHVPHLVLAGVALARPG